MRSSSRPGELDLKRFETLCEEGRRALAAGDPERAAGRLRAALAEWRRPALDGLSFEPFAPAEIARLEALRAAALEDRIEADLRAGRHGELIAELEALVARHPLRERLRAQLMLALYRAGRQSDALAAYREAVRTFDAELGLRPAPELEALERSILGHDPALRHSPPAVVHRRRRAAPRRATATILFSDLVGSTRMRSDLGDEAADAVRGEHDRRVRDAIAVHGGQEVKALGDGFLAVFGSAGAAIACAVDVQRAIDRQAGRGSVTLGARVGVGAGDVGWEGADVFGMPVVEAQRLCAAAGAGQILRVRHRAPARRLRGRGVAGERGRAVAAGARAVRAVVARALDRPSHGRRPRSPPRSWSRARRRSRGASRSSPGCAIFLERRRRRTAPWGVRHRRAGDRQDAPGGRARAHALGEGGVVLSGAATTARPRPHSRSRRRCRRHPAAWPVDERRVQLGAQGRGLLPVLPRSATRCPASSPAGAGAARGRAVSRVEAGGVLEAAAAAAPSCSSSTTCTGPTSCRCCCSSQLLRADAADASARDRHLSRLGAGSLAPARRPS